jgi:putative LysE/RhtB family amino acid efflux pump
MTALAIGFGLGVAVAAQIGPVSLLLIRSVLRHALPVGVALAAAVALVDASYALLGALGAGRLLEIDALRLALGLLGAAVLGVFALRTLWSAFRVRTGGEADEEVARPRQAFLTGVAATASNPLTIISWAAVFAAASTASVASDTGSTAALLVGVGLGSFTWMAGLACMVALARRRVGPRGLRAVDAFAGSGLLLFAGALGYRALDDRSS